MRFFDTNVLVYAAVRQDERKSATAQELIRHALEVNHDGVISVQVVTEFTNVMLNRFKMSAKAVDETAKVTTRVKHANASSAKPSLRWHPLFGRFSRGFFMPRIIP